MIRVIFISIYLLAFTSSITACAQAQNSDKQQEPSKQLDLFTGGWKNENGSLVTFIITDDVVHGTYQTNVGQPDKNQSFPLIGFTQDDQITFTVNFKGFDSMTAWTGQLTRNAQGKPYIRTLWHLTRNIDDDKETSDIWKSIITGASNFEPVK